MTKKQFFKKYLLTFLVYFGLTTGLFGAFMIPLEIFYYTLFDNGKFVFLSFMHALWQAIIASL